MARNVYSIQIEFYEEDPENLKAMMEQQKLVHQIATYARQYKLVRRIKELYHPCGTKEMQDADVCS